MIADQTPWWDRPHAGFDLETTGVNTAADRIVTSNVTRLVPPGYDTTPTRQQFEQAQLVPQHQWATETTDWLVNPGIQIPAAATDKHGITTEYARVNGQDPVPAIEGIVDTLHSMLSQGTPVVTMNGAYDLTLLHFECLRHGVTTLSERLGHTPAPIVDIYVLDKRLSRRKGKRTLTDLATHYGVKQDTAHTSAGDVLTTLRVCRRIVQRYSGQVDMVHLEKLHIAQVAWREEQCVSLQRYFSSIGKTDQDGAPIQIDTCWPLCTDRNHPRG